MNIKIYKFKEKLYIALFGKVVLEECDKFKNSAMSFIDRGISQIYIDLENVNFIDSAGLGVLVGLKMTANKNKSRLILLNPSKGVYDILYVSKLDNIFDIITGKEAETSRASLMVEEYIVKEIQENSMEEQDKRILPPKIPQKPVIQQPQELTPLPQSSYIPVQPSPQMQEPKKFQPPVQMKEEKSEQELIDEYCRTAVELMRQGYYEKAVEEYKKSLSVNPEYLPALNNLAIVYEKKPSWTANAIEQWENVLKVSEKLGDQKHIDRANKHLANLRKMV